MASQDSSVDSGQTTHFGLFELPEQFALDAQELAQRHKALQLRLHPDRFVSAPVAEQRMAEQYIARVNEAYRVLADPLARAAYILARRGCDPFAESGGGEALPMDFLERQMELRETLEELAAASDAGRAEQFIAALQQEIDAEFAQLAGLLDAGGEDHDPAVAGARRLRYLQNCLAEARRLTGG